MPFGCGVLRCVGVSEEWRDIASGLESAVGVDVGK